MLPKNSNETYPQKDREFLEQIPQSQSPSLNGLRVLVVDDNEDCLCIVTFILSDYQAQTKTATSVDEAIEAIEEWKPDIVISDIGMPNKDGYSLVSSIRNKEASMGGFLPAVALTSYVYPEDISEAIDAGFQEVIRKPFEPDELVAVLARLTGQTI
ncbi:response regulator [Nostoc sp. 'Peltigera membranacea cyanobiont' N6]|uniref:response regulator n=1 Tax=Nostoc sp. 'Peltigera membranacea cyanobiont' N6 TaxID=1261031 RepID=UPI000CF339E6|nr:response regulator [Nostoc sp. 'Peltigera membranacea cyanobiont' N6]AVH68533.1 response regulator receiver protein [Nostoc sp. 'Peltigera membranacea cyanobiont' N6]